MYSRTFTYYVTYQIIIVGEFPKVKKENDVTTKKALFFVTTFFFECLTFGNFQTIIIW